MTKKEKITIKINKHIKDKLDKYQKFGYNRNEIITMGIILLEDSKNFELLLKRHQEERETIKEIIELKKSINQLNKKLCDQKYKNKYQKLDYLINWIYENEFAIREQLLTLHGCELEPLTIEYFYEKSELTGIPVEEIIREIIERYTLEYLKDINVRTEDFKIL